MRERNKRKSFSDNSVQSGLVIGVDEYVGKAIATYLHEQNFDVLGVVGRFSQEMIHMPFPIVLSNMEEKPLINLPIDFVVIAQELCPKQNNQRFHVYFKMLQVSIEIAREKNACIICIVNFKYYLCHRIDIEKKLEMSGVEYIILQVPEIVGKQYEDGYLFKLVDSLIKRRRVSIGSLEEKRDLLWLDDLCYFVEKILVMKSLGGRSIELTTFRPATTEQILYYVGKILQIQGSIDVVMDECSNATESRKMDRMQAVRFCFYPMGTLEMARRLLPMSIKGGLGQCPSWYYEQEHSQDFWHYVLNQLLVEPSKNTKEINAYSNTYQIIKKNYKKIYLHTIYACSYIGYVCLALYLMAFENKDRSILHVVIPFFEKCENGEIKSPNKWLWDKCYTNERENIIFLNYANIDFWRDFYSRHKELFILRKEYLSYSNIQREMKYRYIPFSKDFILGFNIDEQEEANCFMKKMGLLGNSYVCFHARDNAYNKAYKGDDIEVAVYNDKMRNTSVENYRMALEKLGQRCILSVRMGAAVEKGFSGCTIIDYANEYRTEMMDFYLMANCKFFVSTSCGIMFMATLFRVPMVFVNYVSIIQNVDALPPVVPENSLMIPKKVWHKVEKRYLSLREMLDHSIEFWDIDVFHQYERKHCELHENTPEEIADVILEMDDYLDGRRKYSEFELSLQAKYRDILMEAVEKSNMNWTDARCGIEFLKKNPWFLE